MIYMYDGGLFSLKKEGNSKIYYKIDEPADIMLSEISQ